MFFSGRRTDQSKFSIDVKLKIYDEWLENSITKVDRRNGQDSTKIRKSGYLEQYKDFVNDVINEEASKRGIKLLIATRKVNNKNSITKQETRITYNITCNKTSITKSDRRNGQDCTKIRKSVYLEQYK